MAILNVLRTATSSHWCWSWWALMSGESRPSYLLSVRTSTLWNQLFKLQFQFATSMTLSYRIHSKRTSRNITGRMPRSGKLPILNLLRPKISIFAPEGRLVAPIWFTWNLGRSRGTWVSLATQNFTPNGSRGWERGPQNGKNFHFLVESPRRGELFDRFLHCLGLLYAQLSCISASNLA